MEFGADLPIGGIGPEDQFGPDAPDDRGDVLRIEAGDTDWLVRLQPGDGNQRSCYELSGHALAINNKGNLYWIDVDTRRGIFVPSRYRLFKSIEAPNHSLIGYDFTDVCLLDSNGIRWRRDGVVDEELAVEAFTETGVILSGWKITPNNRIRPELSLENGHDR